jgi:hypothetical protein
MIFMWCIWCPGDDLYVWDNMREAKMVINAAVDTLTECLTVKLKESPKDRLAPGKWAMALFPRLKSACEAAKMGDDYACEHPVLYQILFPQS